MDALTIITETQLGLDSWWRILLRAVRQARGPPWHERGLRPSRPRAGGDPGLAGEQQGTLLTSCRSVLEAMETDGDASGLGACVSCSPAEPLCENKGRDTVGRRELPQNSDSDCSLCPAGDPGSRRGLDARHVPSEPTSLTAVLPSPTEDHCPWHPEAGVVTASSDESRASPKARGCPPHPPPTALTACSPCSAPFKGQDLETANPLFSFRSDFIYTWYRSAKGVQ